MKIVFIGLSVTSSWGNGHATTYRSLLRELNARGHELVFLERNQPWYATHRDLPQPSFCRTELYENREELESRFTGELREADCVVVGSYVSEGVSIGEWVMAEARGVKTFYDIDTPITLADLDRRTCTYLSPELIRQYDLYLSFTGGPTLQRLEVEYGAPRAAALYCSVDPLLYYPKASGYHWDLGYLGTYSEDRQPALERLLIEPARQASDGKFVVAGSQYPETLQWPPNIERIEHLAPGDHRAFYNAQRFTLNITRPAMVAAGFSPSVRLFEAAACGVPIISDRWEGLEIFFTPGTEILLADSGRQIHEYLFDLSDREQHELGRAARERVLQEHTSSHRAEEFEALIAKAGHRTPECRANPKVQTVPA